MAILLHAEGKTVANDEQGDPTGEKLSSVSSDASDKTPLEVLRDLKQAGLTRSQYGNIEGSAVEFDSARQDVPVPQVDEFHSSIQPILMKACVDCHGADSPQGNVRIDTLNPDLHTGGDVDWWNEVFAVISKGEMPPPDSVDISDEERKKIVDWLSQELQSASVVRRNTTVYSAVRRMTRYEYNHALQDLLGLPWDFAKDLSPEAISEDGFQNSSEHLHMSVIQFESFFRSAHSALSRAIHLGAKPETLFWGISMSDVSRHEWSKQEARIAQIAQEHKDSPEKVASELAKLDEQLKGPHARSYFRDKRTGRTVVSTWEYYEAKYANLPATSLPERPDEFTHVAILPAGQWINVELGDKLPEHGTMRVRVRASQANSDQDKPASLQLHFGWQASNEGRALVRVSQQDVEVTSSHNEPGFYEWQIELGEIYPRNSVRGDSPMGAMPSPSEYIRLINSSASANDIQIDYVEIESPVFEQWPPLSHAKIFPVPTHAESEDEFATRVILQFMSRAWRRPITDQEISQKMKRYSEIRPNCASMEAAVLETLATVIASPHFLYVLPDRSAENLTLQKQSRGTNRDPVGHYELATRLALFLWSSIPDDELMESANNGTLASEEGLRAQVIRMLEDPKATRFANHFVKQWLNLELLEFLNLQQNVSGFDPLLKEAMLQEPVEYFQNILTTNSSVLDFLHSDYAMINERLARHYGIPGVYGNGFRRVLIASADVRRGGLLTQAGLLTMNSDYPDSHPLKRGVWVLERLLNDPPPPPPPAVPQIDLANPEIAKMTLKERIEDHRNQPACLNCHRKIDPWGIAFENYDAIGRWRDQINGKPVDAASELYNEQTIDGIFGVKAFLFENRQDQFVRAMVHKVSTYALGRPILFADRADIERITARVRKNGDGLRTVITEIVCSDLFRCR